jgi:hypothetical protein
LPANLSLITSIANQLLEANASTATQASEQVLASMPGDLAIAAKTVGAVVVDQAHMSARSEHPKNGGVR